MTDQRFLNNITSAQPAIPLEKHEKDGKFV